MMPPACRALAQLFGGAAPAQGDWLGAILAQGLDRLPPPGGGDTLARWQALVQVAAFDLSLAKLYEGHTDALAILQELGEADMAPAGTSWGVWAAEPPVARAIVRRGAGGRAVLNGAKFWCSGAQTCSHALLTAWEADGGEPQLVAVDLAQPGVRVDASQWKAVGMAASASVNVTFENAEALLVGKPGDYLRRAGFWQGGAGIAACWYGGTAGIARKLHAAVAVTQPGVSDALRRAALGKVVVSMEETSAVLEKAARWIDAHPLADASRVALTARLSSERNARNVLDEAGRALGATPFCLDERFARAAADLPVFIRQSHADRDFAALADRCLDNEPVSWTL